jgi:hypothetical protein
VLGVIRLKQVEVEGEVSLFEVLKRMTVKRSAWNWAKRSSLQLMIAISGNVDKKQTEAAYWWLIVYGVLRFKGIKTWWKGRDTSRNSVDYSEISERGVMFLRKRSM